MKKQLAKNAIFIYLAAYFALNLVFLDQFPFMHSDESWLSGLTRAMMHGGFNATEPFFDLFPRYPHAVKLLFHLMQMPFILVFGDSLFAVRLLSLLFGVAALYLFYRLVLQLAQSPVKALVAAVILSLDVQFIYASHFARQDIIIAFGILASLYYILRHEDRWSLKRDIVTGVIIGLFIGVHPNSLMIALAAGALYLYYIARKKMRWRNLFVLVTVVAGFAVVFIGISLSFDSGFFSHYAQTGEALGVGQSLGEKLAAFPGYFTKLFGQVSGTYYTPPIRFQLILFAAAFVVAAVRAFWDRQMLRLLLPVLGVAAGFVLIGRYSQPGVILFFPLGYLLVFALIDALLKRLQWIPAALIAAVLLIGSLLAVTPYLNRDYDDYLANIEASVPADARVLANLNSEYAFEYDRLLDYRNLEYLEQSGLTFKDYVRSRGIEYIVYPEEMDYIYRHRPVWNILYGNLYPYYADMQKFFEESCTPVAAFDSPYAMRIARYMDGQSWQVTVYRVNERTAS